MEFSSVTDIVLKTGDVVSLQMTSKFVEVVRHDLGLAPEDELTQMHIKQYLVAAMTKALGETDVEES